MLAYDPARKKDNSTIAVGELRYDSKKGYMLDIVNSVNFADLGLRNKTPMTTPNQIKAIKQLLLDYNGADSLDYENITCVLVDAGTGGGVNIFDFLLEDWKDKKGKLHRGLIDKEYLSEYTKRYPNAVNILRLLEPTKYKAEMFEALIQMLENDLITFTEKYDNKGYLNLMEVNSTLMLKKEQEIRKKLDKLELPIERYEERLENELSKVEAAKTVVYRLTPDEEVALSQIDAMKEEIVNICRVKRDSGKDSFKLPTHKDAEVANSEGNMYDDRAYTLAMLGWYLSQVRRKHITQKRKPENLNFAEKLPIISANVKKTIG